MTQTNPDGPVIRVDFTLTFDEYEFWCRHVCAAHMQRWIFQCKWIVLPCLAILAATMIGAGIYEWVAGDLSKVSWVGWGGIGLVALLPIWVLCTYRSQARKYRSMAHKAWQADSDLQEPRSCIFSPSSVQFNLTGASLTADWNRVVAVELAGPIYLFANKHGEYQIMPARALENEEDRRAFHQLVEAMVPNCKLPD